MSGFGKVKPLVIGFSALALAACSSTGKQDDVPGSERPSGHFQTGAQATGVNDNSGLFSQSNAAESSLRTKRVFYFDFDSGLVGTDDLPALAAHADFLRQNTGLKVRLSGHADERGTREYNMALGEIRAKAVQDVLTLNGVPVSQVEVISYGEEAPIALGHSEDAWRKNRRVELDY